MPTSTTTTLQQRFVPAHSPVTYLSVSFVFLILPLFSAANFDPAGKRVTFYPSSLMIAHNARPLVFYSDTKLLHLVTKLKAVPPGPSFQIHNNCSLSQKLFLNKVLDNIHNTQKVMNRLLSLSSFSNLLECDSYLRRYYTYSTGMTSHMSCPRHYQSSLSDCKAWALTNCRGLTPHEKMFLDDHHRSRRSSFLCHAGLFGLLRKIYESLGHSCEPTHFVNIANTLRTLSAGLSLSQSMTRVLHGKIVLKATDTLTTKLNRLSQDLKVIDRTFTNWQGQLTNLFKDNACHESLLFEFLSKHSTAVNRAFVSMLRLTEMQDVLHQFSILETKTLFGFAHLPPFLHPQITSKLGMDPTMTYTTKALSEGFPLFINPMVNLDHSGNHVEAGVLLTLPEIPDENSFCTTEYLVPVKYNSSNICYSGPVKRVNLVLINCPNSKQIVTTQALDKCYQDSTSFICPVNLLTLATNISWPGFPFNPNSKLTFPRHHVPATDCTNLHPLLHLGGRSFLATTTTSLPLSTGTIVTSPLAVYNIPCNVSFSTMVTGIGRCPDRLIVSVPFYTANSMQFVPWQTAISNLTTMSFNHPVFDIPPPTQLNKTVLSDLDSTMATLDGELSSTIWNANSQIDSLTTGTATVPSDYIAGVALGLSLLSCLAVTIILFQYRRNGLSNGINNRCRHCRRRCAFPGRRAPDADSASGPNDDQHIHEPDHCQAEDH